MADHSDTATLALVAAWRESGLNRAAFARLQGVPYHRLIAAIRRAQHPDAPLSETSGLRLVQVVPNTGAWRRPCRGGSTLGAMPRSMPELVLRWPGGVELTVDATSAAGVVVRLLGGRRPC
jgi:hypothetical protein